MNESQSLRKIELPRKLEENVVVIMDQALENRIRRVMYDMLSTPGIRWAQLGIAHLRNGDGHLIVHCSNIRESIEIRIDALTGQAFDERKNRQVSWIEGLPFQY